MEVLKRLNRYTRQCLTERTDPDFAVAVIEAINVLNMCQMLGASPVKHGRWIEQEDGFGDTYYDCSCCGESFCLIEGTPTDNMYNFCPNCGARMDGGT